MSGKLKPQKKAKKMTSSIKKLNTSEIELTVELSATDLKRFVDSAEREIGISLDVKGFRKGKVPKDFIKQHVDPKTILDSAMDLALRGSLAMSIKEQDMDVLNVSNLNIKENTANKLLYSVLLTLFPDITLADLNFKVKKREVSVEDKEIEQTLETIKTSRANLVPKNGVAENGDRVEVDFEVKSDGQTIEGGVSKNHPLILGKNTFIPGFEDNLVGMATGEEKNFSVVAPKDYFHKPVAGKKLDIHVKVQDVKKIELPEFTDEFIKSLGRFENLNQLSENIKQGLIEEKKAKESQRVRLEILNTLISKSDIKVPEHMTDKQLEDMIDGFDSDLHRKGMELGPYLAHLGKTRDDLKKDWQKEAEKQVKIMLVLHKVAREKKITAEPEEIEPALSEMAQSLMARGDLDKGGIDVNKIKEAIANKVINDKTLKFLEDHCSLPV